MSGAPQITVIYLLYNAERTVGALVDSIRSQRHPSYGNQEEWLEVLFMDDCSRDGTLQELDRALERVGRPENYRAEPNPQNLGLSRTLNKAFQMAGAPYGLSVHCDVFFGKESYVASMLELMQKNSDAGAITGQPQLDPKADLPFAEKVNLISNLMDIFPDETGKELVPVGFAEGRCDAFRIEALRAVGFYDTSLRIAGEDQLLAARMREKGFRVYQAPALQYVLRASDEQDSIRKLMKHEFRFGKVHPYIVLKNKGTAAGAFGVEAGKNRRSRTILRAWQVFSAAIYGHSFTWWMAGAPMWTWLPPLVVAYAGKGWLFHRHVQAVRLSVREHALLYAVQPLLDFSYTLGLLQGFWLMTRGSSERPIT